MVIKALTTITLLAIAYAQFGAAIRNKVPEPTYELALAQTASRLGTDTQTLDNLFYIESRNNPQAIHPVTRAHGLIQFLPTSANEVGTDTTALKSMSNMEQLEYVEKWLTPVAGREFMDFYFQVFFPNAIGRDSAWVLQGKNITAYTVASRNRGFDINRDSLVQVWEVEQKINQILERRSR